LSGAPRLPALRIPLLVLAALALVSGTLAGLSRMALVAPLAPHHPALHGILMVGAFLGTLIGLERAAALARGWGHLGPLLSAAAGGWLLLRPDARPAMVLLVAASAMLAAVFATLLHRHRQHPLAVMGLGALCWLGGNIAWLWTTSPRAAVPWWVAFLALTIAGERLELARILAPGRAALAFFGGAVLALVAGLALLPLLADLGVRLVGGGLAALAAWLLRHDLARRSARFGGLHRFGAVCLVSGYLWLAVAGVLVLAAGARMGSLVYDAATHAFFLGFVFAMIFAHAPLIAPMLLGVHLPFRRFFYLHWGVLQGSLLLRVTGDLGGPEPWRAWGAWGNAVALGLFLLASVTAARGGPRPGTAEGPRPLST
jgi:hypothetical protein